MLLRRLAITAFLAAGWVVFWLTGARQTGFTVNAALVQAGSNPWILVWAAIAILLTVELLKRDVPYEAAGFPSWARRFAAFLVDFYVAVFLSAPVCALIPLAVEAARTGTFAWSFERRYPVATDESLAVLVVLGEMALIALYFAWPVARNRQSVGGYLLRLRVLPAAWSPARRGLWLGLKRVALGLIAMVFWPFSEMIGRGKDGSTWYDRLSHTRVELVNYP